MQSYKVPYLDIKSLNDRFRESDIAAMHRVLDKGQVIGGEEVANFEADFADYCGVQYCISTGNGHDALSIILKADAALGKLPHDARILLPAHTYIATFLSVINAGMRPVPVDVEDLLLTGSVIQDRVDQIDAIIAVDIYGKMVETAVYDFAQKHSLPIYCDTAQSHGATNSKGNRAGSLARASAFSFYPTKNLGALGDAGAITTNDADLVTMARKIANYGRSSRYSNDQIGVNSRMDTLQAAFLSNRLPFLDADNQRRREIAEEYQRQLSNTKVILPKIDFFSSNAFHVFPVYVKDRKAFRNYMQSKGIETSCHYEIPPHQQDAFKNYGWGALPKTEQLHQTEVSLPCNPIMTDQEVRMVIVAVNDY